MRSLVLTTILFSIGAVSASEAPNFQKKQELSAQAREAALKLDTPEHYLDHLYIEPMPTRSVPASEMKNYVVLGEGWSQNTEAGHWSVGAQSAVSIRIGEGSRPTKILIEGSYKNTEDRTRIIVNGLTLIETTLNGNIVELPPELEYSPYMLIELQPLIPVLSDDLKPAVIEPWRLNFKLERIQVW